STPAHPATYTISEGVKKSLETSCKVLAFFLESAMERKPSHFYEFGDFRLDASQHLLWRDGKPLPLTPKALELLLLLVENSPRVVDKNELMQAVWPDSFVEETNLTRNIFTLRQVLSDDRNGNKFIETVPKRGYRFVTPVREVREELATPIYAGNGNSHEASKP